MIGLNCRKLFKKGKLYEKEAFFGTTVVYEIQGLIKVERYFKECEKRELHDLLWYLYWEYEYEGQPLTARQISQLLGVSHFTIDNILARAKQRIKDLGHFDLTY